jgi:hypothetical protein
MVGAYFADQGDASATIDVLDGHVPLDRPSRELEWLADTHASERPVRQRNLAFFESLPSEVAALPMYARAYGSVLLDTGSPAAAEQHLRAAVAANSDDTFAVLRLLETLRRLGRDAEADAFVRGAREYDLRGPSEHRMAFAHQLLDVGEPGRALRFACELVREHSENPRIATGYFALILEDREQNIIPTSPVVAVDTWVSVKSAHGDHNAFIIDSGKPFLGIDVLPPEHAFVGRLCSV